MALPEASHHQVGIVDLVSAEELNFGRSNALDCPDIECHDRHGHQGGKHTLLPVSGGLGRHSPTTSLRSMACVKKKTHVEPAADHGSSPGKIPLASSLRKPLSFSF